jgi:small subunit ribosomal protein S6
LREELRRVRQYEMMIIIVPDVSEEDLPGAIDRVAGIIGGAGGTVTHLNRDSPWGRRRLAYPIRHQSRDIRDGFYVLYYFDAEAGAIVEIEREIKLFESVMRHMITHQVQPPAMPEETMDAPAEGVATEAVAEGGEAEPAAEANEETVANEPEAEAAAAKPETEVVADEPAAGEARATDD